MVLLCYWIAIPIHYCMYGALVSLFSFDPSDIYHLIILLIPPLSKLCSKHRPTCRLQVVSTVSGQPWLSTSYSRKEVSERLPVAAQPSHVQFLKQSPTSMVVVLGSLQSDDS